MFRERQYVLKDLAFLAGLNSKLHAIEKCHLTDDCQLEVDYFSDNKMSVDELEKMVDKIQRDGLVLLPVCLNFSYGVGFRVFWDRPQTGVKDVLSFQERQLPNGYDFDTLSKVFLSPENIILCHEYKLSEPENDRRVYE